MSTSEFSKSSMFYIWAGSFLAFGFLFWLLYSGRQVQEFDWVSSIPRINTSLNFTTFLCLCLGRWAIYREKKNLHISCMVSALTCSFLFLCGYFFYHYFHGDSKFAGVGIIRQIYFFTLFTHIVASMVSFPMIFMVVGLALKKNFARHKKLARWLFPIWMYASVTGISIFFLLSAYA